MPGEEGVGILAFGCKHSGLVKEAVKASAGRLVPEEPLLRSDLRRIRVGLRTLRLLPPQQSEKDLS
jgi:hypothetical protein